MNLNAEKLVVRQLTTEDLPLFNSLIKIFNLVFEEAESTSGSEGYLRRLLGRDDFLAIAAISENEVVGGLTAYVLPMVYSDSSEVFLYDMAVLPSHQRQGIGRRLIDELKEYCKNSGVKDFFVLAHEEDLHALEFYRSTGGRSEKVVNFLYETTDAKE